MEKRASVCSILEKLIKSSEVPVSCEDLSNHIIHSWGRNFPANPYHPVILVYKLASSFLELETVWDEVEAPPMVPVGPEGKCSVPLSPNLGFDELNKVVEQVKKVKFRVKA